MATNLDALSALISGKVASYQGNSGDIAKPADGQNTYRFIAEGAWIDPANPIFWVDYGAHWIKAVKNGKPIAVVGNSEIFDGTPSPVGAAIEVAIASATDAASKELYESWRANKRVLVNALDRKDGKVKVLELTATTWGKVLEIITLYHKAGQNILDPVTGLDIMISRVGTGLGTEYNVMVAPASAKPISKEHIDQATDLRELVKKKFFRGEEPKALNAIAQISGVDVPGLPSPSASLSLPGNLGTMTNATTTPPAATGPTAAQRAAAAAPALASTGASVSTASQGMSEIEALRAQLAALEGAKNVTPADDVIDEDAILASLAAELK